jgi:predicted HTH transcriptional regulator
MELFNISKRTATSDLSDLVEQGIFRKIGRGKRDLKYVLR